MRRMIIPLLVCLALTGCHRKSATEIAQEQAAAKMAEKAKIKKMYATENTVDYLIDAKANDSGPYAKADLKKRCGTMSLYGKIGNFSYTESSNFMSGKTSSYGITLKPLYKKKSDSGADAYIDCIIKSKANAKKIIDMNVGQIVKIRGYYNGESIVARFVDIVHSENLPDYIGTVPSWTQHNSRYQAMGVDDFLAMVAKNPLRESRRLNHKYFTIKGRLNGDDSSGNLKLFQFQIAGRNKKDSNGAKTFATIQAWVSDKSVQKQMLDSNIRNGQKVAVTGKLYWNGGDYPVMTDVNSVKRR